MSSSPAPSDRHDEVAAQIRDMAHDLRIDGNELEADALTDLLAENDRLRDALNGILTTVEDASVPYERLKVGAIARAGLGDE